VEDGAFIDQLVYFFVAIQDGLILNRNYFQNFPSYTWFDEFSSYCLDRLSIDDYFKYSNYSGRLKFMITCTRRTSYETWERQKSLV